MSKIESESLKRNARASFCFGTSVNSEFVGWGQQCILFSFHMKSNSYIMCFHLKSESPIHIRKSYSVRPVNIDSSITAFKHVVLVVHRPRKTCLWVILMVFFSIYIYFFLCVLSYPCRSNTARVYLWENRYLATESPQHFLFWLEVRLSGTTLFCADTLGVYRIKLFKHSAFLFHHV